MEHLVLSVEEEVDTRPSDSIRGQREHEKDASSRQIIIHLLPALSVSFVSGISIVL